ncbi:MAG TPA: WD40 repeat domain-containing protein [Actinomycetota bacterium]|nr:WD40 repeat domain-containing protein [Actinomycetota bacterium]
MAVVVGVATIWRVAAARWVGNRVFAEPTGTVLVLNDAPGGVIAVDLDRRIVARVAVQGQRQGDVQWPLLLVGDSIVVGWDGIWAQPLSGGTSHLLGQATIALPASQPDLVWLVTDPVTPGDAASVSEVDQAGTVILQGLGMVGYETALIAGIPGGLAYDSPAGVVLWDLATQRVIKQLGDGPTAHVLGTGGDQVVWCESSCRRLHITSLSGGDRVVSVPRGEAGFDSDATFSPDQRLVAIHAGNDGGEGRLVLIDAVTGQLRWVSQEQLIGGAFIAWSPSGSKLFAAAPALNQRQTLVDMYRLTSNRAEVASLPIDPPGAGLLAVSAGHTPALEAPQLGPSQACQEPPDGASGACGFRF